MSYIEKEKLIKADIASIENKVRHAFNQGYDLGLKDGKKRAKPLEQEPFINKPCVSSGVCEHDKNKVLDKIRAEIEDIAFDWQEIDGEHESFMVVDLNESLQIIDKYKAESEET